MMIGKKSKFDINHLFNQDFILSELAKNDKKLLKFFMKQEETLLCVAARHGCIKVVKNLLENGAKVDLQSEDGLITLYYAASRNCTQIIEALLKKGADVNIKDENGITSLHCAAKCGYTSTVRLLLRNRANIDYKINMDILL